MKMKFLEIKNIFTLFKNFIAKERISTLNNVFADTENNLAEKDKK